MEFEYPQYRSLEGFNRHYLIVDTKTFFEASYLAGNWTITKIVAEQYPEMLRIQDMLNCNFAYKKTAPDMERLFDDYV